MEIRLLDRRQQTYRWHLIRTVAVHDDSGRVARWFGTSTDIHQQKRSEETARYLAEASAALASVVDYESTLQKVANLAVPYFADWSAVDLVDDGNLRRLAVAHQDPARIQLAHELFALYPPDLQAEGGIGAVLRTGKPQILGEITEEHLVRGAKDEQHLNLIRSLGLKSYICVPLVVAGNTLGASRLRLPSPIADTPRPTSTLQSTWPIARPSPSRTPSFIRRFETPIAARTSSWRPWPTSFEIPWPRFATALQILKLPRVDAEMAERSRNMMERQVHQLVRLVDDLLDVSRVMRGKIELRREQVELASVVASAVETVQPLIDSQAQQLSVSAAT